MTIASSHRIRMPSRMSPGWADSFFTAMSSSFLHSGAAEGSTNKWCRPVSTTRSFAPEWSQMYGAHLLRRQTGVDGHECGSGQRHREVRDEQFGRVPTQVGH